MTNVQPSFLLLALMTLLVLITPAQAIAQGPEGLNASASSDIIGVPSSETGGISSMANDPSPLAADDGEQVWQVTVRDGGGAPDADVLPTILTSLTLSAGASNQVSDWGAVILANGLFNGATALGEGTVTTSSISYSPLSLVVPDNGSVTLTVKLSVRTALPAGVDNKSFQFRILPAGVTAGDTAVSSQFAAFPAPLSVATENRVQIVATDLAFTDQPELSSYTGMNIAPIAVTGRDGNGNTDDDFTAAVTLSSTTFALSSSDPGGTTRNAVAGTASWANLTSSTGGTGTVNAAATGLTGATSVSITILSTTATSVANGNWNSGATWDQGVPPTPTQDVIIGHTVTLTAIDTAKTATVLAGGILNLSTFMLQLQGTLTVNAGAEVHVAAFNPLPGNGPTPYAFDPASLFVVEGSATGFGYRNPAVLTVTFGDVHWMSSGNATPSGTMIVAGDLQKSNTGELRCGTGSATSRTIYVNGNVTINGGPVVVSNSSGAITGALDVNGDVIINPSGTLRGLNSSGQGTLLIGGSLINNGGTIATGAGTGNWITYFKGTGTVSLNPGDVNAFKNVGIAPGKTVNLLDSLTVSSTYTFADSGTLNCGTGVIKGAGSFLLLPGATLGIGAVDGIAAGLAAAGNIQTATSRVFDGGASYVYNGASAQFSGDGLPPAIAGLTVNNPAGVTLDFNHSVTGTLTLESGKLDAGAFLLNVAPSGTVIRVNGHVLGTLQKTVPVSGGAGSQTFEIGDASAYTPVTASGTAFGAPFALSVSTTSGDHPALGTSRIDASRSVNRIYTLVGTPTGLTDVTFNYVPGDIDGGANTGAFVVAKYDSPNWTMPSVGSRTPTSTQATGISGFSSFAIGEQTPLVTFLVNMKEKMLDAMFRPDLGDVVTVRGSFNDWGNSTNNPDTLRDADLDSIYTKAISLAAGTYDYKFWKTNRGGMGYEEAIGNRQSIIGTSDTTLAAVLFNNDDTRVTFQVNMTEKMREGSFKPDSGDVVKVRGNLNGWNESLAMADPEVDGIYVLTTSVQGGTTINYKYYKTPRNGQDWENRPNRDYAVPSGTPSTIPVAYFDDDAGPGFAVAPGVLSFGNVPVGFGKTDSVEVTNPGTDTVQIATAVVTGAPEFAVVPGGPVAVPPSGSAWFQVTFTPTGIGAFTGNLVFTHDAIGSPSTVALSGFGGEPLYFTTLVPDSIILENPLKPLKPTKAVKRFKGLYPNWANLRDEVVAQGGFQPGTSESDSAGGLRVGISFMERRNPGDPAKPNWKPIKTQGSMHAWLRVGKWNFKKSVGASPNAIPATLFDKTGRHTGLPRGLDFTTDGKNKMLKGELKKIVPKKHNNRLLGEMVALKFNIASSALGKTPAGVGQLVFARPGHPLDGRSVRQISADVDTALTYFVNPLYVQAWYDSALLAVSMINRAFVGPLDTLQWERGGKDSAQLYVKGAVALASVPYLTLPPGPFVAETITRTSTETEPEEEFEDEEFEDEGGTPVAAKLYQNYPNPFNPTTTIALRLLELSAVTIRVYDMLGREVGTVLNGEQMDAGYQAVEFSAQGLASGVYVYRVEVQGLEEAGLRAVQTGKMMLMK